MVSLRKSELVVLVARRREAALFLDVLRDWSALGLVSEFLLVDADAPLSVEGSPCLTVRDGKVSSTSLQANLAARPVVASAHVVCLSQVDDEFSTVGAERGGSVFREVRDVLPSVDVTWVHAISVARPTVWPRVDQAALGWLGSHNVVLVPENSRAPHAGVAQVPASPITPIRLTQQAAALCSSVGLWSHAPRTLFVGEPPAGGGQLVALRTFTRQLDAAAVTSRLVARAIDVKSKYPVPSAENRLAQRFEDEVGAAEGMANRLLAKHDQVLARLRSLPSMQRQVKIGLLTLIGLYLRFFWKALRRAPRDFVDSVMRRASEGIAAAAQVAFLGREGSGYVVTVNGIRGIKEDGTLATPEEHDAELEALIGQVRGTGAVPQEQHDYAEFWKDFVAGALTLLDAGRRSNGLEPDRVGAGEGVVTDPHRVVVPPTDVFEVAADVRAVAKVERVSAYDIDAGRRTHDLLREKAQDQPERAASLTAAQTQLRDWFAERQRSYVGKVGEKLSGELTKLRNEIRGYVQALQGLREQTEVPPELGSLQQSLAKVLVIHAAVFALLVAAMLFITATTVVPWRYGGPLALALVLGWLLSGAAIFNRRQQALFQLRNRMESDAELAVAQKRNLGEALEDLRRLRRLYRQYLDWASALGTFVKAPWGYGAISDETDLVLGEGYPHNHRFGVAIPDDVAIDDVVNRLRPQLFPVGWLGRAWEEFRADLPPIGPDRHLLEGNPDLIFSDRTSSHTSLLSQWCAAVVARDWTGGAEIVKLDIEEALARGGAHQDRLLNKVRSRAGDGTLDEASYLEFAEGLQDITTGPVEGRRFSRAVFHDVPQTTDPWTVAEAISNHDGRAIPKALVVTEISRSFGANDLVFCGAAQSATVVQAAAAVLSQLPPPQV